MRYVEKVHVDCHGAHQESSGKDQASVMLAVQGWPFDSCVRVVNKGVAAVCDKLPSAGRSIAFGSIAIVVGAISVGVFLGFGAIGISDIWRDGSAIGAKPDFGAFADFGDALFYRSWSPLLHFAQLALDIRRTCAEGTRDRTTPSRPN